jgi:hypothetical protein
VCSYEASSMSSHGQAPLHVTSFISPSYGTPLHICPADVSLCARPLTNMGHPLGSPFGTEASRGPFGRLGALELLLQLQHPITCSHHLYHMRKIDIVSSFPKMSKPLRSLTTPKMLSGRQSTEDALGRPWDNASEGHVLQQTPVERATDRVHSNASSSKRHGVAACAGIGASLFLV